MNKYPDAKQGQIQHSQKAKSKRGESNDSRKIIERHSEDEMDEIGEVETISG